MCFFFREIQLLTFQEQPQHGVKARCSVGFLYWSKYEADSYWQKQEIGSMLRTPSVPIWLFCLNRRYGLIFSTNINLLNNWIYEDYFQLHVYIGLKKQEESCLLTIDTRQQYPASVYGDFFEDTEQHVPDFIQLLQTRFEHKLQINAHLFLYFLFLL